MADEGEIRIWCKGSRNLGLVSVRRRQRCRFGGQTITCLQHTKVVKPLVVRSMGGTLGDLDRVAREASCRVLRLRLRSDSFTFDVDTRNA